MRQGFFSEHWADAESRPAGGVTTGRGFTISWQNGPLGMIHDRAEPNGAFVEDVICAAIDRLEHYQASPFECKENADALMYLRTAVARLEARTARREAAGVEGTHGVMAGYEGMSIPNSVQ